MATSPTKQNPNLNSSTFISDYLALPHRKSNKFNNGLLDTQQLSSSANNNACFSPNYDSSFRRASKIYKGLKVRQAASELSFPNQRTRSPYNRNTISSSKKNSQFKAASPSPNNNQLYSQSQDSCKKQKTNQSEGSGKDEQLNKNSNKKYQNRMFHDKAAKQRKFINQYQNDKMAKRLNDIKSRKNKYIQQAQKNIQFQKQHKLIHESTVQANRKLKQIQIINSNDRFIDRLIERTKYKQTIKSSLKEKSPTNVKLQQSRMKVMIGAKDISLPPMDFSY